RGPYGAARLGAAGARGAAVRPGLVPRDQLPPPAPVQGGLDRGLPGGAGGLRHRHRSLVGAPVGAVPARRYGPVRLGEGTRWLRRGARVVGDPIRTGGGTTKVTTALRADYDAAAADWAGGPEAMYEALARSLVASAPVPLAGSLVLDLGAGTGVAGRAALAARA